MKKIKLLLVDDHQMVREGLRNYFSDDKRFQIVAEAGDGKQALEILKKQNVDIVMTDINMPIMNGIELTEKIIRMKSPPKIIILTTLDEPQYIKQLMKSGAEGYLFKNSGVEEVKKAIIQVSEGNTFLSAEVSNTLANFVIQGKHKSPQIKVSNTVELTAREKEILNLVIQEYSNGEIAEKLFISPRTVDSHKRKMLEKTDSRNIAGLIMYAINNELLENQ